MNRRTFLSLSAAAAVAGCKNTEPDTGQGGTTTGTTETGLTPSTGTGTGAGTTSSGTGQALPIPPELTGTVVGGRTVYELVAQYGSVEFLPGQMADTMGFNGDYLGPTLRLRRGDDVTINVTNDLSEVTTCHWHGGHVPATMDGGPHQNIAPGDTWSAEFTVNQDGCTLFYHPHAMGTTGRQVYMGLAGLLIIDDDVLDGLDLPKRYGIDDVPLVLQDRRFTADGQLDYSLSQHDITHGLEGDVFLTNGVRRPVFEAEDKELRLRVLNACNARLLRLGFDDDSAFSIVAGDNSLLEAPELASEFQASPAERIELVLDLTGRMGDVLRLTDRESGAIFLEITVGKASTATTSLPASLTTLARQDPLAAVRTRTFVLEAGMGMNSEHTINGVSMDMAVINEVVPIDEVEIWEVSSAGGGMMGDEMHHNFHMHAGHFEILDRNGNPPAPWELGFKDTVLLLPGDVVRLVVKHTDYADAAAPYMYHCHILEHEDGGMMGQFVVV